MCRYLLEMPHLALLPKGIFQEHCAFSLPDFEVKLLFWTQVETLLLQAAFLQIFFPRILL